MPRAARLALCSLVLVACGPGLVASTEGGSSSSSSSEPVSTGTTVPPTGEPTTGEPGDTTLAATTEAVTPGTTTTSTTSEDDTSVGPNASTGPTSAPDTTDTGDTGRESCAVVEALVVDDSTDLEALGCIEEVIGDAKIGPTTLLTSLAPLKNLRKVGGGLLIVQNPGLVDLTGLDSLEHVGGWFGVFDNDSLVTMKGLEKLTSIGGYIVARNPVQTALSPLGGAVKLTAPGLLVFSELAQIEGFDSLAGLKLDTAGTLVALEIEDNPVLTSLEGLGDCCAAKTAGLRVTGNPALTSLAGLEAFTGFYHILLVANDALTDLSGLGGVQSVGIMSIGSTCYLEQGKPEAIGNASLISLAGMNSLTSVEALDIIGNPKLPTALAQAFADAVVEQPSEAEICENLGGFACQFEGPCPQ